MYYINFSIIKTVIPCPRTFKAVLPALTKKSTAKINATPSLGSPNIVAEASRTTIAPEGTVAAVFPISESIKMV